MGVVELRNFGLAPAGQMQAKAGSLGERVKSIVPLQVGFGIEFARTRIPLHFGTGRAWYT